MLEKLAPQLFTYAVLLGIIIVAAWRAVRGIRATGERVRAEAATRVMRTPPTKSADPEFEAYLARIDRENEVLKTELSKMRQAREGVSLELSLTLTAGTDVEAVLTRVLRLVEDLDRYERKIGGGGLRWDKEGSTSIPGVVTLVLHPNEPGGSRERMKRLADIVAYEIGQQTDVEEFTVRGFLTTDEGRTVFEESPSLAA